MHRKDPLEEFFMLLVHSLKLVHKEKDLILECNSRQIYSEAMKRPNLEFYEYISFIQNYLDKYVMRLKYHPKPKPVKK